jgi:predicted alpha-1,6-mannanase (GH76 family)
MRARAAIVSITVLAMAGGLLSGFVLGAMATVDPPVPSPPSLGGAAALQALAAFDKAFYSGTARQGFYVDSATTGLADFWKEAEMIETVEDYYRLTGDPAYKNLVVALCRGVIGRYGSSWLYLYRPADHKLIGRRANDDIMWMVIAFTRAHAMTGDPAYLQMARRNFDSVWARAWSSALGGALWWRTATDRPGKNTTTNAPAVVAAVHLYNATHDGMYLGRARSLYGWLRGHLFDPRNGRVFDGLVLRGQSATVDRTQYTYDQGSFIGAAEALYSVTGERSYYSDALLALQYTRAALTQNGILQNDSSRPDQDSGGFKGIFARWALAFTRANHITSFDSWFRLNADMAWSERNAAGLVGWHWAAKTGTDAPYSWDCSAVVAMMEALLPARR